MKAKKTEAKKVVAGVVAPRVKKNSNAKIVKKKVNNTRQKSRKISLVMWLIGPFVKIYRKLRLRRQTSAHKSFVRTRGRDRLKIPKVEGYVAFSWYVFRVLWNNKLLFGRLLVVFVLFSTATLGVMQVSNMTTINQLIDITGESGSFISPVIRSTIVVSSALGGALTNNLSDVQNLAVSFIAVFTILTIVWLLRQRMAGNAVTLRNGLYSSGAPILALYVLVIVAILQLIPLAGVSLIYATAVGNGLLTGGIDTAMFSIALFLVGLLTLYFMTTTLFALFIATIPGTYPMKAYRTARQIVTGQRLRLVVRLLWMVAVIIVMWFMLLMPIVIITNSLSGQDSIVIPLAIQFMIGLSLIYGTAYSYLLYRRMIDDPVEDH